MFVEQLAGRARKKENHEKRTVVRTIYISAWSIDGRTIRSSQKLFDVKAKKIAKYFIK